MNKIEELELRISHIESIHKLQTDHWIPKQRAEQKDGAAFLALRSIVAELATHAGIPIEHLRSCEDERRRYFEDVFHRRNEDTCQSLAAQIDDRSPDEEQVDESYRPIFDIP